MTTWRSKSLGDGISASIHLAEIEALFGPVFEAAGRPAAMAVFMRHEAGGLHCEVVAYFSPAAQAVAMTVGAQPCEPPSRPGLELLVGAATCWQMLFP